MACARRLLTVYGSVQLRSVRPRAPWHGDPARQGSPHPSGDPALCSAPSHQPQGLLSGMTSQAHHLCCLTRPQTWICVQLQKHCLFQVCGAKLGPAASSVLRGLNSHFLGKVRASFVEIQLIAGQQFAGCPQGCCNHWA